MFIFKNNFILRQCTSRSIFIITTKYLIELISIKIKIKFPSFLIPLFLFLFIQTILNRYYLIKFFLLFRDSFQIFQIFFLILKLNRFSSRNKLRWNFRIYLIYNKFLWNTIIPK